MSDLEFVQRCINKDSLAWDEFLVRYSRLIYKYIHSVLNAKGFSSHQDYAGDIFQEFICFLIQEDYRKLKTFKALNGSSLATWLRQVTVNFTLDYLRKIKFHISIDAEREDGSSLKDILTDASFSIPELINQEEKFKALAGCIEELSVDDQFLIELNIHQGIRLEALRELLRLSRGAIDMQKSRILNRLKECFKRKGLLQ